MDVYRSLCNVVTLKELKGMKLPPTVSVSDIIMEILTLSYRETSSEWVEVLAPRGAGMAVFDCKWELLYHQRKQYSVSKYSDTSS